jgi:hypothetical protein
MLPGLNFEPLPAGKENRKGNELGSPHQVIEGLSERFFQQFWLCLPYPFAFPIRFGSAGLKAAPSLQSNWRDRP